MVLDAGWWVLLSCRVPRAPSTPRIVVWRRLRQLGVAQPGDGLVALPEDAGPTAAAPDPGLPRRLRRELQAVRRRDSFPPERGGRRPGPHPARPRCRRGSGRRRRQDGRGAAVTAWATRAGVHIDRASWAWPIRRFLDPDVEFVFVDGPEDVPAGAVPLDLRGVELGHQGLTVLRLTGPVLGGLYEDDKRSLLLGKEPA